MAWTFKKQHAHLLVWYVSERESFPGTFTILGREEECINASGSVKKKTRLADYQWAPRV